ncbi:hypothetical protein B0H66DRAFT_539017 [Apodospora peruviana]|uniref:Uncharacterized protein n=1 Tax=Apodospora peruviana TaxID=516989 RepID=A0AAE0HTW8_9PEZI|nr:hypothetical protein B0H66DRAFT_539017 [Apodospora peruviana]
MSSVLRPLLAIFGVLASLQPHVQAAPSPVPSSADTPPATSSDLCSDHATVNNLWAIKGLKVTYTPDETKKQGNATFILTNTRTKITEALSCPLRFNYICEFHGTPGDPGLSIWLQLNLQMAYITINQSWACGDDTAGAVSAARYVHLLPTLPSTGLINDGESSTAFAVGTAEVTLVCPEDSGAEDEDSLPCHGIDAEGYANGSVTVTAPQPPPQPETPPLPVPPSNIKLSRLRRRAAVVTKGHAIKKTTVKSYHPKGNLELMRKKNVKWDAIVQSLGRRRSGNARAGKTQKEAEVPVGKYPIPKVLTEEKEPKKKKTHIKVDIEHLCSPSCRGGPKPPSWHLKGLPGRRANPVQPLALEVI